MKGKLSEILTYTGFTKTSMSSSPSTIPLELRDIIRDLEFLSQLKKGLKVNVKSMDFAESKSWLDSLKRTFFHEGKEVTVDFVSKIVDNAIEALSEYETSIYLPLLIDAFRRARVGVGCLTETYCEYPKVISDLRVCIANMDLALDIIQKQGPS